MKDYVNESFLGMHTSIELSEEKAASEYWKINIYYLVMDNIISNFIDQFQNIPLADSIDYYISYCMSKINFSA